MAGRILRGEKREGRNFSYSFDDGKINVQQTRTYRVETNSKSILDEEVALTPGLPIAGITLLSSGAICKSVQAYRDDKNAYWWNVVCQFNNERPSQQTPPGQQDNPDPTTWIPIWRWTTEYTREPDVNNDNDLVKNTNHRPFSEQRTVDTPIFVAKFSQYMPATIKEIRPTGTTPGTSPLYLTDFASVVNDATYKNADADQLLCILDAAEYGTYNGFDACRLDLTVKWKRNTWLEYYWARDRWYWDGANGLKPIKDKEGRQVEWFLTSSGGIAGNPVTGTAPSISTVGTVSIRRYDLVDFNTLFRTI